MFSNVLERWGGWIDPSLGGYLEGQPGARPQTDSHLNAVSIEYPEEEICNATHNFSPSSMLGAGTFGSVYKGTMKDGTEVAIKVLQVPEEAGFEEEVKVLSRFRHPNLVILMGFSRHVGTGGRSLVYEYLAGGDISRRLQKSRNKTEPFEWKLRVSAALDAASGLSHLHNATPRAFHRDIKGPNILLDKNGTAKMADFGLSCVSQYSHHKVQQASGTVGYACSEYIRTGIITEGSEVHSFGMVLLELLTGAPPAVQRPDKPSEFCYLVDHLKGSLSKVIEMLDKSGHFPLDLAQLLAEMSFRCINPKPAERPSFVQLVGELRRRLSDFSDQPDPTMQSYSSMSQALGASGQHGVQRQPSIVHRQSTPPAGIAAGASASPTYAGAGGAEVQGMVSRQGVAHQLPAVPAGLSPGQTVEARRRGGHQWQRGHILRSNPNNTFAIRFDDNDYEDQVLVHYIRALEAPSPQQIQQMQAPQIDRSQSQNAHSMMRGAPSQAVRGERSYPAQSAQEGRYAHGQQQNHAGMNSISSQAAYDARAQQTPPRSAAPGQSTIQRERTPSDVARPGVMPSEKSNAQANLDISQSMGTSQGSWCRLSCVFAEAVTDLSRLADHQRNIEFPRSSAKLTVGRNKQPSSLWDVLVPDGRLRGTVSREHFDVVVRADPTDAQQTAAFYLVCLSLNGLLLNREFVRPNDGEKRLQHGDILAFAANLDGPTDRGPGPAGALPRKPFLHFLFELPPTSASPAPAAASVPAQVSAAVPAPAPAPAPVKPSPAPVAWVEEDDESLLTPAAQLPEGAVAGRWRKASLDPKADALFCLEVHGEGVDTKLPSEARKLVFESADASAPPSMCVGRLYQRGFWQRVLKPEHRGGASLDADIFEIRTTRKNNPATREAPAWRHRLRIQSPKGILINYGTPLGRGEEHELQPSDTITIGLQSNSSSSSAGTPIGGLHLTFIPYYLASNSSHGASLEVPRLIPDFSEPADDGIGGLVVERSMLGSTQRTTSIASTAGALRAPVPFSVDLDGSPSSIPPLGGSTPQQGGKRAAEPLGTIMLDTDTGAEPDDLFSKTGFGSAMEGRMPALAGNSGASAGRQQGKGGLPGAPTPPRGQEGTSPVYGDEGPKQNGAWFQQLGFFSR